MSNMSATQPEFDFWEFVSCSLCKLPFASESGPTAPFWLTECGHVVCNTHLNSDQSCAHCGSPGVELVPLQPQMDAPMSEWFRSIPNALDAVTYAAKFQQETMASQIRFYKARERQQRSLTERLKRGIAELKKTNEILTHENAQFRQHFGYQGGGDQGPEPSGSLNANGKRPMNDSDQPRTSSSRSVVTPLGPTRLTLPPGQQPPTLSSNRAQDIRPQTDSNQNPSSSHFVEKYSYVPPSTQFYPPQLSYNQAAPRRAKQNQEQPPQGQQFIPSVQKFKPQRVPLSSTRTNPTVQPSTQNQRNFRPKTMGPPPTPQQVRQTGPPFSSARRGNPSLPASNRFAPPTSLDQQRFIPATTSGAQQRFPFDASASGSSSRNVLENGQRVPFVPHNSGGLG
ncbi:hypothetical protein GGX14DRAFT_436033 [Mycena pura]|uniref:RING-type domain-containing protein n=1 Tax=Mycena pura TaxID=153505 RepID=A0AAD6YGW1_9AGAR|nr:hypothetical protein GGX14DRAFT_436033 [Mycena pura]